MTAFGMLQSDTLSEAISRVVCIARRPVRRLERCGKMKEGKHLEGRVLRVLFSSAGVRALVVKLLIGVERQVMFLAGDDKDGSGLSTLRPKPIRWRRSFLFQGSQQVSIDHNNSCLPHAHTLSQAVSDLLPPHLRRCACVG